MSHRFTRRFRVRHYELDASGRVGDVTLVRYMQESAIEASAALGLGPDWYRERGTAWVVRRLAVRCLAPAGYGDEVGVTTWVSGLRGVRCTREYDLTRGRDGARVARARAEWVYVDAATGQPALTPDGWAGAFPRRGAAEDVGVRLGGARRAEGVHRYASRRRVRPHELDAARHVNHAVYLRWAGEASLGAFRAAGHPPERARREGWAVLQAGHEVQYFAPALGDDDIEVVSWVCELGEAGVAWTHEAYDAGTRRLLARDYSLGAFVGPGGEPVAVPRQAVEDVLRGPAGA